MTEKEHSDWSLHLAEKTFKNSVHLLDKEGVVRGVRRTGGKGTVYLCVDDERVRVLEEGEADGKVVKEGTAHEERVRVLEQGVVDSKIVKEDLLEGERGPRMTEEEFCDGCALLDEKDRGEGASMTENGRKGALHICVGDTECMQTREAEKGEEIGEESKEDEGLAADRKNETLPEISQMMPYYRTDERTRKLLEYQGKLVSLDGVIGAGKSSLGLSIEKMFNESGIRAKYFPEYINLPYLKLMISDTARHSFGYQMLALSARQRIHQDMLAFCATGGVAIGDRSLVGDLAFALMLKHLFTEAEWEAYRLGLESYSTSVSFRESDVFIYLAVSTEIAMKRIRRRGRDGETGYEPEYIDNLERAYEEAFSSAGIVPRRVDWNEEREVDAGGFVECIDLL